MWERACVGAGLPAMQTTRSICFTEAMLSQASQLPQKPLPTKVPIHIELSGVGYCAAGNRKRAITGK